MTVDQLKAQRRTKKNSFNTYAKRRNAIRDIIKKIDIQIRNKEVCREIIIKGSKLLGELSFTIEI